MLITIENASDVVKLLDIVNVFKTVRDSHKNELETYLDKIDELETKLDELQARHNHLAEQKRELRQEKAEAQKVIDDLRKELRLTIEKNEMLERANFELQDRTKTPQSCDKSVVANKQHNKALEDVNVKLKQEFDRVCKELSMANYNIQNLRKKNLNLNNKLDQKSVNLGRAAASYRAVEQDRIKLIEEYAELETKLTQHQAENELLQARINSSTQEKALLEAIIVNHEDYNQELVSDYNKVRDDLDYTGLISTKLCEVIKRHYPKFTYEQFCAKFDKEAERIKKFNARGNKEKKK